MAVEFRERVTLGAGWELEVRRSRRLVGHIRKHPISGAFLFFPGAHNELAAQDHDGDLDALKRRVESRSK